MKLLGTLHRGARALPCSIGIERDRVVVVAQDDLARFSWPVESASLVLPAMELASPGLPTYRFVPDLPDRFRWVMTAALQEAMARRRPWWRRRRGPLTRGLDGRLETDSAAA